MATVDIRVELPAYSHSFQIRVDGQWSVREVKDEIRRTCKGSPKVDGQRLIWRGRFLRDEETVKEIWKSADDARIVHLSVHPSGWTDSPPSLPDVSQGSSLPASQPPPLSAPQPQPNLHRNSVSASSHAPAPPSAGPSAQIPLGYILNKHNTAIHVLTNNALPTPNTQDLPSADSASRAYAINILQTYGYSWPSILDDEYPSLPASEGVKYERVTLDNQPYLSLVTPNGTPSPIQLHALKVLSYTFPLLPLIPPDPTFFQPPQYNPQYQLPTMNLNQHLQQLGFPGLRMAAQPNANQNPADPNIVAIEVRAIPFRALMVPLMMLLFRTFLLIYFFSPTKRPVFGLILSAWIFYEAWGALRGVLGGDRQNNAGAGQAGARDGGAGADQAQRGQGQGVANANANSQPADRRVTDRLVRILANRGLDEEEAVLNGVRRRQSVQLWDKVQVFTHLFFATLHPAVWDRRRTALRKREGRLRTEEHIRDAVDIDETTDPVRARARQQAIERHERRPGWIKTYVQRVLETEFVDDA